MSDGTCINCGNIGNWCTCGDEPPEALWARLIRWFRRPRPLTPMQRTKLREDEFYRRVLPEVR